jgi:hypothetical protein
MLQFYHMYFSYYVESPVIYTLVLVPPLFASCVFNYTSLIPKTIEIYMTYYLLNINTNTNTLTLKYTEYIYIFMNIFFNYIQLRKPISMAIYGN